MGRMKEGNSYWRVATDNCREGALTIMHKGFELRPFLAVNGCSAIDHLPLFSLQLLTLQYTCAIFILKGNGTLLRQGTALQDCGFPILSPYNHIVAGGVGGGKIMWSLKNSSGPISF